MDGKRMPWLLIFSLALAAGWPGTADAALPWAGLLTLKRVEAEADKEYRLTEDQGPWMIMACSFSGQRADEQARELVFELRKRYKFEAYTHRIRFDFGDAPGRGIDQFGAPLPMRYWSGNQREEIAVLVGNYRAVDDPAAQKSLARLKYLRPRCLDLDQSKPTTRILAAWRLYAKYASREKQKRGPMGKAFITTNPLLPKDFFVAPGIDPLVLKMNKHVKHSLLDCPGKYTVQVATFKGQVVIKPSEIEAIEEGKKFHSRLADAALKAHQLTEALRMKGYEAYEFHDRYASIVTVGSFESVGTPRRDGKIEINPHIHRIMKTFGAQGATGPVPIGTLPSRVRTLAGIPLDVQPIPVLVPKRSISSEMARRSP